MVGIMASLGSFNPEVQEVPFGTLISLAVEAQSVVGIGASPGRGLWEGSIYTYRCAVPCLLLLWQGLLSPT